MKCFSSALAILISSAISANSQSAPQINSDDWEQRAAAAREMTANTFRSVQDDIALTFLLIKEDGIVRAALIDGTGVSEKYGEEYGEYVGALGDTVLSIANRHPDYPNVWTALVNAPYNPDSQFVKEIARHADRVMPLLLAQAVGSDLTPGRTFQGQAIETLARIVSFDRIQSRPKLTPTQVSTIDTLVRSSLSSQKDAIRIGAIKGLAAMGSEDDIAVLGRLASDAQFGSIATNALKELRKRLDTSITH